MKGFLISDESVNRYSFVVKTTGIKLEQFKNNPVMFYNHKRELGVIGRWENIYVKDNKLYATPVFDKNDELGAKIKGKVEQGFIKAASIGIDELILDEDGTVTSCLLLEISICDIPANANALQLYNNNEPVLNASEFIQLNHHKKSENMQLTLKTLQYLGLNKQGNDIVPKDVQLAIEELVNERNTLKAQLPNPVTTLLNEAIAENLIQQNEVSELQQLGENKPKILATHIAKLRTTKQQTAESSYNQLLEKHSKKALHFPLDLSSGNFKTWALYNLSEFEKVLERTAEPVSLMALLKEGNTSIDKTNWSLDEYRKYAPKELAANPVLYQQLLEKQKTEKQDRKL